MYPFEISILSRALVYCNIFYRNLILLFLNELLKTYFLKYICLFLWAALAYTTAFVLPLAFSIHIYD